MIELGWNTKCHWSNIVIVQGELKLTKVSNRMRERWYAVELIHFATFFFSPHVKFQNYDRKFTEQKTVQFTMYFSWGIFHVYEHFLCTEGEKTCTALFCKVFWTAFLWGLLPYERTRKRSYHNPGIHIECGGTNSVNHCIMKLISYFQVDFSVSCIEIVFRIPCHVIRELRTRERKKSLFSVFRVVIFDTSIRIKHKKI